MKKILIATATYNEYDNIKKLIQKIFTKYPKVNILVIDDKSPDKTYKLLKYLETKNKNLNSIIRKKKLGLNTAHKKIFNYALDNKYDYLITMDADLSHNPKDIKKIIKFLKHYDFVIGSRYIKNGKCKMSILRFILSKCANCLIKFILKTNLNENTTSFRGFNLNNMRMKKINLNRVSSSGYSFFMECIFYLIRKKCSIKEIPIVFNDRKHGKSKISKLEILRTLKNLMLLKLGYFNY